MSRLLCRRSGCTPTVVGHAVVDSGAEACGAGRFTSCRLGCGLFRNPGVD
ncbi:hypothetical protein HMPREF0682_2453 [Propionibacterium acidifaciens F0233]|uniref:Uncharacterized protein n=1 Tax=Propionibacterium acidifaciens F0233 TaxID=553198 RepID=U2PVS1_9ACTN|nr:hypothetical protein HMPREF0682_2453 [Propionibacterium acidifaciens F0233]